MPKTCTLFNVSPLLRELMKRAGTIGETCEPEEADSRIMQVIVNEPLSIEPAGMPLPLGNDPKLRLVTDGQTWRFQNAAGTGRRRERFAKNA